MNTLRYYIAFKRPPIECDMAERFCPVRKPCNECNEYFNSLPVWDRVYFEIPRWIGLIKRWAKSVKPKSKGGL
jgi:hypothetical protein